MNETNCKCIEMSHFIPKIGKFEKISYEQWHKDYGDNDQHTFDVVLDEIPMPKRATKGSAGYDFVTPFDIHLEPSESRVIPTGIRCKMNGGWMLCMFPKSGLGFKFKTRLANTVGIIDADYYYADNEGHIMVKLCNEGDKPLDIAKGKAFCQGIFLPFGITEDDETDGIRTGGFGSTGK